MVEPPSACTGCDSRGEMYGNVSERTRSFLNVLECAGAFRTVIKARKHATSNKTGRFSRVQARNWPTVHVTALEKSVRRENSRFLGIEERAGWQWHLPKSANNGRQMYRPSSRRSTSSPSRLTKSMVRWATSSSPARRRSDPTPTSGGKGRQRDTSKNQVITVSIGRPWPQCKSPRPWAIKLPNEHQLAMLVAHGVSDLPCTT
jgi:hypothetical protein